MNILILGGAGFIGQHLSHKLLEGRKNRVTVIDSLATSSINLEEYSQYKNLFEFIESDINDIDDAKLLKLFRKQHKIYHFAGSVGVEHIDKDPKGTLFNNVDLMNKLIPLFKKAKTHVIFSSTSEIYGEGPFNEESNASIGPSSKLRWGYATAKLMAEFMIRASDIPYTIIRFFNIVGPGQVCDYGMVLPRFVKAAKSNEDLTVYGTGSQIRSFCHINDAINGILLVSKDEHVNNLFNIGNNTPTSIYSLANKVIELTKSDSKKNLVAYEDAFSKEHGDINERIPDLNKIQAIGYETKYDLDDIINDMIK